MHWPAPWGLGSVSHHSMGCISCGILLSGTGARGVSSEHMENVEMFSENCALVWLSENRDLVLGEPCSGPQRTVLWHVCLREVKNNLFSFKHSYLRHFS